MESRRRSWSLPGCMLVRFQALHGILLDGQLMAIVWRTHLPIPLEVGGRLSPRVHHDLGGVVEEDAGTE